MAKELSAILNESPTRFVEWASKVTLHKELNNDDKEVSQSVDAWAKEIGRTGHDANHEISAMITKAITLETVDNASAVISRMFEDGSINEFDDYTAEVEPKNTIKVYEGGRGGNVDRSFIDHKLLKPTWVNLTAETDISLAQIRRGGFKTIAKLVADINEALENKKVSKIFEILDKSMTTGMAGVITEATSKPTEASADALALYLNDVLEGGTPLMFGQNKYMQTLAKLAGATSFGSSALKDAYNQNGFINSYAGCELLGFSGQKKLPSGEFIVPDKKIFGIGGTVGKCITRGSTNTLQETDINSEKIHIKVNGYQFGILFTDLSKVGKIAING